MSELRAQAAVVAIGDELLSGEHVDTNSAHIARALAEHARDVRRVQVIGDDEDGLAGLLAELLARYPLVITTGGLGPTLDDVTRHAAARALGRELVRSEEAWQQVHEWYARSGREVPSSNERQALLPAGAELLHNERGTAPGFRADEGGATLFVLPGPPHEMVGMLERHVLPWLESRPLSAATRRAAQLHLVGLSESQFAVEVGAWMQRGSDPQMGVTAKDGVLSVRVVARGSDPRAVEARLAQRIDELAVRFADHVLSADEPDPGVVLARRLIERGITITVAESCTGGMVAARLTAVAGVSAVLREGFVTYSNEAKVARLGVPKPLLDAHGAVSSEVAEAMAEGAARASGADLALAVTGIAGPGGGSEEKPVGLVWFGWSYGGRCGSVERRFPRSGREPIRRWAATFALALGLQLIEG